MDRNTLDDEVISPVHGEASPFKESTRALARFHKKGRDPSPDRRAFQSRIDCRADPSSYQVEATIEMIDMAVGFEVAVASDPSISAFCDEKYPANRLLNIALGVWLGWTPNSDLPWRIVLIAARWTDI